MGLVSRTDLGSMKGLLESTGSEAGELTLALGGEDIALGKKRFKMGKPLVLFVS